MSVTDHATGCSVAHGVEETDPLVLFINNYPNMVGSLSNVGVFFTYNLYLYMNILL